MSHKKYEVPRKGSLGFLPKKRTKHHRGRVRSFPKDELNKPIHFTAFLGYKAGMTHVARHHEKREGKKVIKKDIVEPVTIIECPPMKIVGLVGYIETPRGLRALSTVWCQNIPDQLKRRFYKNWQLAKKKAFQNYAKRYKEEEKSKTSIKRDLDKIKKHCTVVRALVCSQLDKLNFRQRKAHLMEIQVNGGKNVAEKVDFVYGKFEAELTIGEIFKDYDMIDTIGVTRGKGTSGVVKRWGVTRLPRKTHRGLRRVGCIGAWHPASVRWTCARTGQLGYFHRTEMNKKIYRMGAGVNRGAKNNAATEADVADQQFTVKNITPLGGFPHYGEVNNDYLMLKGCVVGTRKRPIVLRKSLLTQTHTAATEHIQIKFIDTSSKIGHGKYQNAEEKHKFLGPLASKQKKE